MRTEHSVPIGVRSRLSLGVVFVASGLVLACSSDADGTAATGGTGGTAAAAGSSGSPGTGGTAGDSGSAGTAGTGGSAGSSGAATGGASGSGGSSGTAGTAGTAGSGGSTAPGYEQIAVRSASAVSVGLPGSWPEQFMHAADRSISDPSLIVYGQDVSTFWISEDDGATWRHVTSRGLKSRWSASVRIHPAQPDVWIAAMTAPGGQANNGYGVYKTTNRGADWTLVHTPQKAITGSARPNSVGTARKLHRQLRWLISFDPQDPQTVYFANPYDGLYRSSSGGDDWSRISASAFDAMGRIFHVEVHPQQANILYFATEFGFFRSNDGGTTIGKVTGNGLPNQPTAVDGTGEITQGDWVTGLDVNPQDGDDVYVAVYERGLYRSNNRGNAFNQVRADNQAARIAVHRTDRNVMYLVRVNPANLIHSTDGGSTWSPCNTTLDTLGWEHADWKQKIVASSASNALAQRSLQVAVLPHPTDSQRAVATASAAFYATSNRQDWVNGGLGFDTLAWGHANGGGGIAGNIAFDLTNPDRFMTFNFDEGAFLTEDGANSFEHRGGGVGAPKGGQYVGSFSVQDPQKVVSTIGMYSEYSAITQSNDGGKTWFSKLTTTSDPSTKKQITWVTFHPQDDSVLYSSTHRSVDGGQSWQTWQNVGNLPSSCRAIAAARSNGDVLYALDSNGGTKVYRSEDRGVHWSQVYTLPYSIWGLQYASPFEVDSESPDIFYTLGDAKGVARVDVSGANASVTDLGLDGKNPGQIVVDQYARTLSPARDVLYAANIANGAVSIVWRKVDAGAWEDISHDLPRVGSNRSLSVHPLTGDLLVGGTVGTRLLPRPYDAPNASLLTTANLVSHWVQ